MPHGFIIHVACLFLCNLISILLSSRWEKEQMTFETILYNRDRRENRRQ